MKKKKLTGKPQLVFSTMTGFSVELMDAFMTAGRRGMPDSIMVFCTITTLAKMLKTKGIGNESITEMFTSGFNAYVKLDQHMTELFRKE